MIIHVSNSNKSVGDIYIYNILLHACIESITMKTTNQE